MYLFTRCIVPMDYLLVYAAIDLLLTRGASGYSSQSWYLCVCMLSVCRHAESSPDVQISSILGFIGLI